MAIYHARVKTFSRAKQHSSAAAAAYRAGLAIVDPVTGQTHNYRHRGGVVETLCIAPEQAPDWAFDPRLLWPEAEVSERRRNATVAREFEIALPHELNDDQRSALTAEIAHALVDRYGFAVQASVHEPQTPDGLNYHVHILATTRRMGPDGLTEKTRELDGGPSGRGEVEWIREMVAQTINDHLAAAQIDARVDHRSLQAQADAALEQGDLSGALALTREATQHIGKNATALHRKGVDCERTQVNQAIADANEASFQAALADLGQAACLMPTPDTHSHARARQERDRAAAFRLPQALEAAPERQIRVDPALIGAAPAPPAPDAQQTQVAATRAALGEASRLWGEGFFTTISLTFQATTRLLRHQVDRLATYVHSALFRSDVRELLDRIKQVKRDALRFQRRMKAEDRAQHELAQAEMLLERFDSEHPRPGKLIRQEWMRRRARRLRAVQVRQEAHRQAHEATGPKAQGDYNTRALASAQQLENFSQGMLARYPVQADQAPIVGVGQAAGEAQDAPETLGPKPSTRRQPK